MKSQPILPVVLSGGSGTRLWPRSRRDFPKQFLSLAGERSLLQDTVFRVADNPNFLPPVIVASETHRFLVADQLMSVDVTTGAVILEPCAKNTAPALACAAMYCDEVHSAETLMLVMPADHVIEEPEKFLDAVSCGVALASAGSLVTFGITPESPHTGYGYIKAGEPVGEGACQVDCFIEKPDQANAEMMLAEGGYSWNSGIFLCRADAWLTELERFQPIMFQACQAAFSERQTDADFVRLSAAAFRKTPADSIDYSVMEKTSRAVVIPVDCGWSDLGSWSALADISETDEQGNAVGGDVLLHETKGCLVHAESRLVATIGIEDTVVVETADAVMVARKNSVQDVKAIVAGLQAAGRSEATTPLRVNRPWGWYQSIQEGPRFKVKRINVAPGRSLSLQRHQHRAEHWVVVSGTATVTNGQNVFELGEDESTYIPKGTIHRLENKASESLEIIEVQTGGYLEEDDIERFEDNYGRANH